jgi:predicted RNA binding protein YcfA (HicA-like mRNA interferase family)
MPSVEKIIAKMRNQPYGIMPEEACKVLEAKGYHSLRQKGSHHSFRNDEGQMIVMAEHRPLNRACVENILKDIGEN